ncbi:MAG: DUF3108 domain-containing protein [Gammaproteobacteria bacterium]|nr:DUF3108 domain-containing protein [Gammaproteobacteria bacterium]
MLSRRLPILLTIAAAVLSAGRVDASPLPEFVATYRVEKSGLSARIVMTLRRDGSFWRFESHSEPTGLLALFDRAYVSESSMLEQRAAGLRPIAYEYNAGKRPSKRDVASFFDWKNGTLKSNRGDELRSEELLNGTFDRLSVLLAIVAQLRAGAVDMEIPVAHKGNIRTRRFVHEEDELIKVVAGSFETARVRELRTGHSSRNTVSWFAPGEHYLPVRMDQYKEDKHVGRVELIEVRWQTKAAEKAPQ